MTTTGLDRATGAVDTTIETLRYDPADPAELSAVVGALRELFWHTTTLTRTLAHVYDRHTSVGHDHGHDPDLAVAAITSGLQGVAGHLAAIDRALTDVHNTAAHLHRADPVTASRPTRSEAQGRQPNERSEAGAVGRTDRQHPHQCTTGDNPARSEAQ